MKTDKQLWVSLIDLPAELGSHQELDFDWTVPEGWATEVLALPEGTVIPLHVSLTALDAAVLARVQAEGRLEGECVRCVDAVGWDWKIDTSDVYVEQGAPGRAAPRDEDVEVEGDELDPQRVIDREAVDLEPLLRDAILGGAPLQPLCREACQGLCPHCGIRMEDAEEGHSHEFLDPRFAALEGFFDRESE